MAETKRHEWKVGDYVEGQLFKSLYILEDISKVNDDYEYHLRNTCHNGAGGKLVVSRRTFEKTTKLISSEEAFKRSMEE